MLKDHSNSLCRAQGFSSMRRENNDSCFSVSFKLGLIEKNWEVLKHEKKRPSQERD